MFILGVVLAVLIGVSLGLLGGGGSILTVPILLYVFRLPPEQAIASSLLVVSATSAAALIPHARGGRVRWRTGLSFGAASMAGAYLGGRLSAHIPPSVLLLAFGAMMLLTAGAMLRGRRAARPDAAETGSPLARIVAQGLAVGAVTGLVGAGGGFLVVPALALLGGLPMQKAIGTSLLVIALKSFAGYAGHAAHVTIDFQLAALVSGAAVVGSLFGSRLGALVQPDTLRRGFAGFVLLMGGFVLSQQL